VSLPNLPLACQNLGATKRTAALNFRSSWVAAATGLMACAIALCGTARAQTASPPPPPAAPAADQAASGWTFNVAPYLWLPSINGNITVNRRTFPSNATIAQIFEKSEFPVALMVHAEALYDRFGVFLEPMYTLLRFNPGNASVRSEMFWLEFGGF